MKSKVNTIVSSLVIKLALIIVINLVASFLYLRLDFSKGRMYSLGRASKEAVRTLEDNFIVKVYATPNLPADFQRLDRYLKDLLGEYNLNSRNRFRFEYVRFTNADEFRTIVASNNLRYNVVPTYENDQMAFREVVYGITFEYKDTRQSMNLSMAMESRLEYEITTTIQSMSRKESQEIAVFRDSTYSYMNSDGFERALSRHYKVHATDLNYIPNHVKVMLFTGVVDSLSVNQMYQIDQFLMHGGKLVVLQERIPVYWEPLREIESNFFDLMKHYGVNIHRNMVLDLNCDIQSMGMYDRVPYPMFPITSGTKNSIVAKDMNYIVMYIASQISTVNDSLAHKLIPQITTSHTSAILSGPTYDLESYVMRRPTPDMFPLPPQTVAALYKSDLISYFETQNYPLPQNYRSSVKGAEIMFFGDRELVVETEHPLYGTRWYAVLNALDYFLDNDSMIKIRSRSIRGSSFNLRNFLSSFDNLQTDLTELEQSLKTLIKSISIALPTLLLIFTGILVFLRYKAYRKRIKESYEKA